MCRGTQLPAFSEEIKYGAVPRIQGCSHEEVDPEGPPSHPWPEFSAAIPGAETADMEIPSPTSWDVLEGAALDGADAGVRSVVQCFTRWTELSKLLLQLARGTTH